VAADPGLRTLRSCPGGCFPSGNGSAPAGRSAAIGPDMGRDPERNGLQPGHDREDREEGPDGGLMAGRWGRGSTQKVAQPRWY
jgi:hypothetical protein